MTATDRTPAPSDVVGARPRDMRRILLSSLLGTALEYYDFILYATAAGIVFDQIFFGDLDGATALYLSFGTLAVGYLARPLGGVVFGHLGDRLGRKAMLVVTVALMGVSSTLIGLLPTQAQIGIAAPLLLVTLRIVQGIAIGGEWGGAMLIAFEHARRESRGFAASFAYVGAPVGTILATLVLSAAATLPRTEFLSWGWRIPFLLSAVLMTVVVFIRLKVAESPAFLQAAAAPRPAKVPAAEVLTTHRRAFTISVLVGLAGQAAQGVMGAWAVSWAVQRAVLAPSSVLNVKALAGVGTIVMIVLAARLSDRLGRIRVMVAGAVAAMALAFPITWLLEAGSAATLLLALFLGLSVIQGFTAGPYGAFAAELFPAHVRYSGTSMGYQLASTLGAGFTPLIAAALVGLAGGGLALVALAWMGFSALSLAGLLWARRGAATGKA
ncbi:MFS transporter [Klenkia sp. PcliD-1-E]|uniref:MFS transporter n=1 Tax=Klenkia sp. PcliD-1-E TaxID=2954492 RepID=UPI002096B314|nr:MFS transporter [Klenkia sp. PcliD-1-E]MCO7219845.1 MFS transporter [Klenkia sp. PcliD-1-E]